MNAEELVMCSMLFTVFAASGCAANASGLESEFAASSDALSAAPRITAADTQAARTLEAKGTLLFFDNPRLGARPATQDLDQGCFDGNGLVTSLVKTLDGRLFINYRTESCASDNPSGAFGPTAFNDSRFFLILNDAGVRWAIKPGVATRTPAAAERVRFIQSLAGTNAVQTLLSTAGKQYVLFNSSELYEVSGARWTQLVTTDF